MTWQDKLAGKPRLFSVDYIYDFSLPSLPGYESIYAKFPLNIVSGNTWSEAIAHRNRVKALNPNLVEICYIAANHASVLNWIAGPAQADMVPANPFVVWADGTIPRDPSDPTSELSNLYDYRKDAWRTSFFESIREALYVYEGVFIDNMNVWDVALDPSKPMGQQRREFNAALQDAIMTVRGRYPNALIVGNSDLRMAGVNGEMIEDRTQDFKKGVVPYSGHVQPEMNLCLLYSTTEINCMNAYKFVRSKGGWFGSQKQAFDPQWWDWYLP